MHPSMSSSDQALPVIRRCVRRAVVGLIALVVAVASFAFGSVSDAYAAITLDQFVAKPHPIAQNSADQDVGVEHDSARSHEVGLAACLSFRRASNSLTISSSSNPIATSRSLAFFAAAE